MAKTKATNTEANVTMSKGDALELYYRLKNITNYKGVVNFNIKIAENVEVLEKSCCKILSKEAERIGKICLPYEQAREKLVKHLAEKDAIGAPKIESEGGGKTTYVYTEEGRKELVIKLEELNSTHKEILDTWKIEDADFRQVIQEEVIIPFIFIEHNFLPADISTQDTILIRKLLIK